VKGAVQQSQATAGLLTQPIGESQAAGGAAHAAAGANLKKIKIDNSRLKSFQAAQPGAQGQRPAQKFIVQKQSNRLQVLGSQNLNRTTVLQGEQHRNSQSQSRSTQQSRVHAQEGGDVKASLNDQKLNQTTPQSEIRAHLEEVKNSMNLTRTQDSQGRKLDCEDGIVMKSADSNRYAGR